MKRYLNILFVLFFAIGVYSCGKDELEDPSQMPTPESTSKSMIEGDEAQKNSELEKLQGRPIYINDDGDEEDEGLKPTILPAVKN